MAEDAQKLEEGNDVELLTGRIYIIQSPNTEMVYIGSTITSLKKRFEKHLSDWRIDSKKASASKFILEKGSSSIKLLEKVQVESERELDMIEQQWINKTPNTVNIKKAYISEEDKKKRNANTHKKYYEDHKEKILEDRKEYRKKNKEKIQNREKELVPCEVCDCLITRHNMRTHESSKKHQKYLENVAEQ